VELIRLVNPDKENEQVASLASQKARGAFFTPPAIADYLAAWAVADNSTAKILDPTCGEGVFLLAAGRQLARLGRSQSELDENLFGVDLHESSLDHAARLLEDEGLSAHFVAQDFFTIPTPAELGCPLPSMDAVIGNPPFVRYQMHRGNERKLSAGAALRQGVRLSGLASSWAALVVHACAFLKPEGRLAMVLPAELLTVNYAEPIRRWLRRRFAAVNLVLFERLQFEDALEKVVLVVAQGEGGCDAFTLWYVEDAADLSSIRPFDPYAVATSAEGKWTELLLPVKQRQLFRRVVERSFSPLAEYGTTELGSVTGANSFFAISETIRQSFGLDENLLARICPPGTRHLKGTSFTNGDWERLRERDERVWLLRPPTGSRSRALKRYVEHGERMGFHEAYKCTIRDPWWRPPMVSAPDLFFTYMSHRFPRLIANAARISFLNSMHGVRLKKGVGREVKSALPLLALNSVTMLGAEVFGRSYGGGILKMEPREAAQLPVPASSLLKNSWEKLKDERAHLDKQLRQGLWTMVLARVDEVLLCQTLGLNGDEVSQLHEAARMLRERRLGSEDSAFDRSTQGSKKGRESGGVLGRP
jgi:adenine-specific DNA-methyltransferase